MRRKLIAGLGLAALVAGHTALVAPFLSAQCCTATFCTLPHKHPAPSKPDCHSEAPASDCSLRSCNHQQQHAIGLPLYVLPVLAAAPSQPLTAFEPLALALFFPAPAQDLDSPPPRLALA